MNPMIRILTVAVLSVVTQSTLADVMALTDEDIQNQVCASDVVVAATIVAQNPVRATFVPSDSDDKEVYSVLVEQTGEVTAGYVSWDNSAKIELSEAIIDNRAEGARYEIEHILIDGRSIGRYSHMTNPIETGTEAIWFLSFSQDIGYYVLPGHPEYPLPLSDLPKVRKMAKKCK